MVDICLIPEVDFDVPALMAQAKILLAQKGHIVVGALRCHVCVSSHCLRHGKTWLNVRLPFWAAAVQ